MPLISAGSNESQPLAFVCILAVMAVQTLAIAVVAAVYFIIRYLNRTDVPKIKGLPEIPGVPLFGNLLQLGDQHAQVTAKWAKKYGPVFQVRMGNKVSVAPRREAHHNALAGLITLLAYRVCQQFRLGATAVDQGSVRPHFSPYFPYFPQRGLQLARIHNWHVTLGRVLQAAPQSGGYCAQPPGDSIIHADYRP